MSITKKDGVIEEAKLVDDLNDFVFSRSTEEILKWLETCAQKIKEEWRIYNDTSA